MPGIGLLGHRQGTLITGLGQLGLERRLLGLAGLEFSALVPSSESTRS